MATLVPEIRCDWSYATTYQATVETASGALLPQSTILWMNFNYDGTVKGRIQLCRPGPGDVVNLHFYGFYSFTANESLGAYDGHVYVNLLNASNDFVKAQRLYVIMNEPDDLYFMLTGSGDSRYEGQPNPLPDPNAKPLFKKPNGLVQGTLHRLSGLHYNP